MKMLIVLVALLLAGTSAWAAPKSAPELIQIAQAGGSLILDLEKGRYSAADLKRIASSLRPGARLTIRMGQGTLSTAQCLQIAGAMPGQVVFWLE